MRFPAGTGSASRPQKQHHRPDPSWLQGKVPVLLLQIRNHNFLLQKLMVLA